MEKIKVGIIGAGWIAAKMAQALAPLDDAETVAIMEQMDALRKEWGVRYPMD